MWKACKDDLIYTNSASLASSRSLGLKPERHVRASGFRPIMKVLQLFYSILLKTPFIICIGIPYPPWKATFK
jgi:hypothetical protein